MEQTEEIKSEDLIDFQQNADEGTRWDEKAFTWFLLSLAIVVLGVFSTAQVFLLFLKLSDGLNASDVQVSFIVLAWILGGMIASIVSGRLADKVGKMKVILAGLLLAAATPLFYWAVPNVELMALLYGMNGVSFMILQTTGFALAGDIIPPHKRGRLFSQYNAVMALSWGPAGLLIGGPIADVQTEVLQLPKRIAYVNTFVASSTLILFGALIFQVKVKKKRNQQ